MISLLDNFDIEFTLGAKGKRMGYFDGLASGSLKKNSEDQTVFYPFGILGKGYILPDQPAEQRIRAFLVRYYKISLPVSIVFTNFSWVWATIAVIIFAAWFYFGTKALVANYQQSDSTLTLRESFTNSAVTHNAFTLWIFLIFSFLLLAGSILIVVTANSTKQQLIALTSVVFFGTTSAAIAYMLWSRRKRV
jgi:hypothetical protein